VRSAEREDAGYADGTEGVQAVGVGERLILRRRLRRVPRPLGLPVVVRDARGHSRHLLSWKTALGKDLGRKADAPLRVIGAADGVPDVVQQSSSSYHLGIRIDSHRNTDREGANAKRMSGIVS
jgi:hypothetical protein